MDDPRSLGKPLTGPQLGALWRYRIGDCRIICDIQDGLMLMLVLEMGSRKEIYRKN